MLELGQPTHAYDLDRLPGPALGVRAARPGRAAGDARRRRAGAGRRAPSRLRDLSTATTSPSASPGSWAAPRRRSTTARPGVALEAAHFVPMAIARTSKRLGLRSEASARFERGVDVEGDRPVGRPVRRAPARRPARTWPPAARRSTGGRRGAGARRPSACASPGSTPCSAPTSTPREIARLLDADRVRRVAPRRRRGAGRDPAQLPPRRGRRDRRGRGGGPPPRVRQHRPHAPCARPRSGGLTAYQRTRRLVPRGPGRGRAVGGRSTSPLARSRRPRPGRSGGERRSAPSTRWSGRSRSCGPRCCPGCCGRSRSTRTGATRRRAVRDRPGLVGPARPTCAAGDGAPGTGCPTSARCSASCGLGRRVAPTPGRGARPGRRLRGAARRRSRPRRRCGARACTRPDGGGHRRRLAADRLGRARSTPRGSPGWGIDRAGRVARGRARLPGARRPLRRRPTARRARSRGSRRATSTWPSLSPTRSPAGAVEATLRARRRRPARVGGAVRRVPGPGVPAGSRSLAFRLRFVASTAP